ncbi:hypothetical protein HNQ51_000275 [Inhella inkyongensis]|uniref:DUF2946 domain-containing protein n=1 Tax=Inhella inkyongensis TaxID=392593 RepID=A0A840S0F0_9BURK|nr:hypothetical protein [Inhella inkyongensis]MBB5202982.1 hypothetical protein [Inhella inkyongensis]
MPRLFTLLVLLLSLIAQPLAFAHAKLVPEGADDLAHSMLHWAGEAHHHDAGDIQLDDSEASAAHMGEHHCCTLALPAEPLEFAAELPHEALPLSAHTAAPTPYLDGLLRPPRA